jgi:hypothetical protein
VTPQVTEPIFPWQNLAWGLLLNWTVGDLSASDELLALRRSLILREGLSIGLGKRVSAGLTYLPLVLR